MEQGGEPALGLLLQPAPNGGAVHAEERGHIGAEAGVTTGQQLERVQALLLGGVALPAEALCELLGRFMHDGKGAVHQVLTPVTAHSSDCR